MLFLLTCHFSYIRRLMRFSHQAHCLRAWIRPVYRAAALLLPAVALTHVLPQ
jgi:hypothetical protein